MSTVKQYEGVLSHVNTKTDTVTEMYPEIKTDTTLSVSGKAADAAVVGAKMDAVNESIDVSDLPSYPGYKYNTDTGYMNVTPAEKYGSVVHMSQASRASIGELVEGHNELNTKVKNLAADVFVVDGQDYGNTTFGNDLNDWSTNGVFNTIGGQTENVPPGTDGWGTLFIFRKGDFKVQLYRAWNTGNYLFFRCGNTDWKKLVSADELGNYALNSDVDVSGTPYPEYLYNKETGYINSLVNNEFSDAKSAIGALFGYLSQFALAHNSIAGNVPKIQKGTATVAINSPTTTPVPNEITFEKPFSSVPTIILDSKEHRHLISVYDVTTTGFKLSGMNDEMGNIVGTVTWVAIE